MKRAHLMYQHNSFLRFFSSAFEFSAHFLPLYSKILLKPLYLRKLNLQYIDRKHRLCTFFLHRQYCVQTLCVSMLPHAQRFRGGNRRNTLYNLSVTKGRILSSECSRNPYSSCSRTIFYCRGSARAHNRKRRNPAHIVNNYRLSQYSLQAP